MPLNLANVGEEQNIKKIRAKNEVKRFLEGLGFVEGQNVTVVSSIAGNLICNVKDARIAIDKGMACLIMV